MCLLCFYRFSELPEAVLGDFLLNGRCDACHVNLVPRVLSLPPSRKYPGFGWSRVSLKQTAPQGGLALLQEAKGKANANLFNWHEDRGMEVISSLFFQRQGR